MIKRILNLFKKNKKEELNKEEILKRAEELESVHDDEFVMNLLHYNIEVDKKPSEEMLEEIKSQFNEMIEVHRTNIIMIAQFLEEIRYQIYKHKNEYDYNELDKDVNLTILKISIKLYDKKYKEALEHEEKIKECLEIIKYINHIQYYERHKSEINLTREADNNFINFIENELSDKINILDDFDEDFLKFESLDDELFE